MSSSQDPQKTDDVYELYESYKNHDQQNIPLTAYNQENVTALDFLSEYRSDPIEQIKNYLISLFPILKWIPHYNMAWLYSDIVAGITVGVVMVPQSMSYAQLAGLEAQYGLYSAFVGVFIYCFFATSKDVSIGPVAVMSLEVSKVINRVQIKKPDLDGPIIATTLSLICGCIALGIGLLRLGFLLELISIPAVMGFMSGSAFSIICGQIPALMGFSKFVNTRDSTYLVVINSLKNLKHSNLDAVFGLIPLFILYAWKWICNNGPKRYPKQRLWFFYIQALRNGVVIIIFTLISWIIIRHDKKSKRISVLGKVPSGLRDVGLMQFPSDIIGAIAPELPAATIILLLEHISISKSFGRINNYKIIPDQELIAIGATNLIGTLFNAYPATGSFSRSALKAKCNVQTPLAGIFTGACVLLALYALTEAFYYIPKATLAAVIIHAVSDLIASYTATLNFWRIAPLDSGIFLIAVLITIFSSIENGIYFAICASCVLLLLNIAFPKGSFLGRVRVAEVINPSIQDHSLRTGSSNMEFEQLDSKVKDDFTQRTKSIDSNKNIIKYHVKWVPLIKTTINREVDILPPPPGVIVFRPSESWIYLNCSRQYDIIFDGVKKWTRPGKIRRNIKNIDRPWNDPGPFKVPWKKYNLENEPEIVDERPLLKVLAFDFTSVNQIDSTSIQTLVDLRKAINKYVDHDVEYHFAGILSPWIRRALVNSGFGVASSEEPSSPVNYVDILKDEENRYGYSSAIGTNTPFFHLDLPSFDYLDTEESLVHVGK